MNIADNYITLSLETHLFFARIMKEHSLFLEAGFPCKDSRFIQRAEHFRKQFEELLSSVVKISDGRIGNPVLESDELITEFTQAAENRTELLSGIPVNTDITKAEGKLQPSYCMKNTREILMNVQQINERSICLLNGLITLKENILNEVSNCSLFTFNYPLLIEHIIREAKLYRSAIRDLMNNPQRSGKALLGGEEFWNRIMMEHALYIRGLLDPSEEELIKMAHGFVKDYKKLLEKSGEKDCALCHDMTGETLEETIKYRDFKATGTKGILACETVSVILPLLADHVLREANHYIRILKSRS